MKFPKMLLYQIGSGAPTVPSYCTHIFLLGGFWDTTEPERDNVCLREAEGNTSVRGTIVEEDDCFLPGAIFFLGDARLRRD